MKRVLNLPWLDKPVPVTRLKLIVPKSERRIRFELEWSAAMHHASQALNLSALGLITGVQLMLSALLSKLDQLHTFLKKESTR